MQLVIGIDAPYLPALPINYQCLSNIYNHGYNNYRTASQFSQLGRRFPTRLSVGQTEVSPKSWTGLINIVNCLYVHRHVVCRLFVYC